MGIQQADSCLRGAWDIFLSCPRPSTSGSKSQFTAWSHTCLQVPHRQQPPEKSFVVPTRWLQAPLTFYCMGAPPKRPQNKHTRKPASETTTEYHLICSISGTLKMWSQQVHEPAGINHMPWCKSYTAVDILWAWPILTVSLRVSPIH